MGLDLGAGTELAIEALMAAPLLQQQVVFQGHPGEVGHQLAMAAMHIAPLRTAGWAKHIQTAPLATAGDHRGAQQGGPAKVASHQLIKTSHQAGLASASQQAAIIEVGQLAQQIAVALQRGAVKLLPPEAAIAMEGQQQGPLGLHQAGRH